MNLWFGVRIALDSLWINRLRSSVTILGVIIGVGAVITMIAVGAGAEARVAEQIQSLGSERPCGTSEGFPGALGCSPSV